MFSVFLRYVVDDFVFFSASASGFEDLLVIQDYDRREDMTYRRQCGFEDPLVIQDYDPDVRCAMYHI